MAKVVLLHVGRQVGFFAEGRAFGHGPALQPRDADRPRVSVGQTKSRIALRLVKRDELEEKTIEFARRIAKMETMAALLIKESVNQTQDNQGFYNSLNACFTMHELNHSHWAQVNENKYPVAMLDWKNAPPVTQAVKDEPGAPLIAAGD